MELVEREQQLQSLADAWAQVNAGAGRIVLVSGEAGIGKTALIERFVAEEGDAAHILRGGCDDLFTPQPLGPFIEIAVQSGQPRLQQLLASTGGRLAFSAALFHQLQQEPAPVMVILEDLHWADEATLDVLKYLGRRIQHLRALLLVSYRNDEVSRNHPLRSLLGDLPASLTVRLALPQLSPAAVAQLARQAERRPEELYRVTGGNPFFVTEVLAGPAEGIPPSAREAIRLAQEPTISLIPALVTLGRLLARRGDPAAGSVLDDAYGLALPTRESQRQGPVAAARAEAAWLRGEPERIAAEADFGYALALSRNDPWVAGEVAYWAWRGGRRDIPLERLARPFADVIRGEWRAAAEQWAQLGCPFEQALALLDGDEAASARPWPRGGPTPTI